MNLQEDMGVGDVMQYVLKVVEKIKMSKYNDVEMIMKLMKLLKVDDPCLIIESV